MDPALLHQRLDMLLKSSSSRQSSRRRLLPSTPRATALPTAASNHLSSNASENELPGEPAPQRFRSQRGLDASCQRSGVKDDSIIGDETDTKPRQATTAVSSTTAAAIAAIAQPITCTPELRPVSAAKEQQHSHLAAASSSTTTTTSSMKKTRILHRMRRQPGNITFELPPVSSAGTTTSTAATPPVTAPLHLPTAFKTPTCSQEEDEEEPHPVTPRQTVVTPASSSKPSPKQQYQQPPPPKKKSHQLVPGLTLSAYRRPQEMVRLTSSDPSRILEQDYDLKAPGCKVIGHGAYSTVRSALRVRDQQMVAIKSISKFDAMRARRLRKPGSKHMDEWEIMKLLDKNPYTLSLLDLLETDEEIHLVTELCEGGELFDAIKRKAGTQLSFRRGRFSEPQAARITEQILVALREMHQHGIVHRDIKPENVLLLKKEEDSANGMIQVKLGDFGVARVHYHHDHDDIVETASAASSDGESSPSTPGLLLADKVDPPPEGCRRNCGPASDMFSLGVTLYMLLCGFPPVFCEHQVQFPDAYWQDISAEAKVLLQSMLQKDPEQRVSGQDALKNAWVRQQQKPSSRGRRGSMCANLELVRSHLAKSLSSTSTTASTGLINLETKKTITGKRSRRGSIHFTSPKRARRSLEFPLTDLYTCQEKRGARTVQDRSEASPTPRDVPAVKVACN